MRSLGARGASSEKTHLALPAPTHRMYASPRGEQAQETPGPQDLSVLGTSTIASILGRLVRAHELESVDNTDSARFARAHKVDSWTDPRYLLLTCISAHKRRLVDSESLRTRSGDGRDRASCRACAQQVVTDASERRTSRSSSAAETLRDIPTRGLHVNASWKRLST